ncbi:MAG: fructoselysine 6-kinase [Eubacteriales bacterium]|nr:fructoselysine 6-kinase [Eubacteriales bacterium]
MSKKIRIAAVGDNCIDSYDQTGEVFAGGNPVNVAVYTVRLGEEASYTGVVGDDDHGTFMKKAISSKGVDISHLKTLPGKTAVTHVEIRDGERILGEYEEGVLADFKLSEEDIFYLASHDLVVTGIWGMIEKDLPALREKDVKIAFDFATFYEGEVLERAIPYVDYAFFAKDDAEEDLKDFMIEMKEKGAGMVIVTRGEKGSMAFDGYTFTTFGIIPCNVVDTMGAGDSFIAGFLVGSLKGLPVKECMIMGASNSSVTLGYSGAW